MNLARLNRAGPRWLATLSAFLLAVSVFRWTDGYATDKAVAAVNQMRDDEAAQLRAERDARFVCIHPADEPVRVWTDSVTVARWRRLQNDSTTRLP